LLLPIFSRCGALKLLGIASEMGRRDTSDDKLKANCHEQSELKALSI
jgi:hypothetical protein